MAVLTGFLLAGTVSYAQQFGGFPPGTRWKQIDTDTARLIFSSGSEDQAQRIASIIHHMAADTTLGKQVRKINTVLHGKTTLANGYVGLAPFRSEYYLVPGSNIFEFGNLPWAENLAVHEYRHVQQYNNFRQGLSKGLYLLFGERGLALANALAVPDWFYEGDAVYAETVFTPQGRGRLPFFLSGYNSLWQEGRNYNWMKLRNGSLKDYVPNHYQLGYLLVNYGYSKYGNEFWKKVTSDAVRYKRPFYPFQAAVKKHAGVPFRQFRKEALEFYSRRLPQNNESLQLQDRTLTNYHFPQFVSGNAVIYLKSGYNTIPAFYLNEGGKEKKIGLKAIGPEEWFSYREGTVAYTAFSTHPRWSLVNYSDIVLLDVQSGKEKRITRRQRYFTPDLAPSRNKIAAVYFNDSLETELHILDGSGRLLSQFTAPGAGYLFSNPRFIDEERLLVGLRDPQAKMTMQLVTLPEGKFEQLVAPSYHTLGLPSVANNTVYFTASFGGNDDLYSLSLKDKKLQQLTHGVTGNYYATVWGDSLVYSRFTTRGLQLQKHSLATLHGTEVSALQVQEQASLFPVAGQPLNILAAPNHRFSTTRYPKHTGLFNFHSWSPDYNTPEYTFSLYGDNVLGNFSNTVFYRYNENERSHGLGWNTAYGGLFPVINAGAEYTFNRYVQRVNSTFNQFEGRIGYNIPLNLTKDKTFKFLNLGSNFVVNRTIPTGPMKDSFLTGTFNYLHHFFTFSQQLPRAVQHIYPRFGWAMATQYRHRLDRKNYQAIGTAQAALPSFGNHSILLSASIQEVDTNAYVFSNRFAGARGYFDYYNSRMWRVSGNYHLPLFYPDKGFANIVYLQRLRGNLFYDFSRLYAKDKQRFVDLRSTGAELFFDTKWWNALPLSLGVRYSYLLDAERVNWSPHRFELVLPVDLIPN